MNISSICFKFIAVALNMIAVFPERNPLRTMLRTHILYNIWPKVFVLIWVPLVPMVTLKMIQFASNEMWEELLDIMHMYFVGCNCLYLVVAAHRSCSSFQACIEGLRTTFKVWKQVSVSDLSANIIIITAVVIAFFFYIVGTIYYGEVLVPLWVPFIDNDQEYPTHVFVGIWMYEVLAGGLIFVIYGIVFPSIIFITTIIIKELNYMIYKIENLKFDMRKNTNEISNFLGKDNRRSRNFVSNKHQHLDDLCTTEEESKLFIKQFVTHHIAVLNVTRELSTIHSNMFFTLSLFAVVVSCFLAFNMYYTERLTKVVIKSSPILAFAYYILFAFCSNGQKLTDKYEEMFRALYRCRWYDAPHSFKTSLRIVMQKCFQPVTLSGGGIFQASLHSFSQGVQQSISYVLILKQLTPERK